MSDDTGIRRRTVLRQAALLVSATLTAGCAPLPLRFATPTVARPLRVLAAYTGSPAGGDREPSWLPVIRSAVEHLNASAAATSASASLDLSIFSADQAPGAYQQQGGQRVLWVNAYLSVYG